VRECASSLHHHAIHHITTTALAIVIAFAIFTAIRQFEKWPSAVRLPIMNVHRPLHIHNKYGLDSF
jgi:hypothetical protein